MTVTTLSGKCGMPQISGSGVPIRPPDAPCHLFMPTGLELDMAWPGIGCLCPGYALCCDGYTVFTLNKMNTHSRGWPLLVTCNTGHT